MNSHNNALSACAPKIEDCINASPEEIIHNDSLIDKMENILKSRRLDQYTLNIRKKIIGKQRRFKKATQESHLKFAHHNKDDLYEIEKILDRKREKVLIKWLGYRVPMWESNKILK